MKKQVRIAALAALLALGGFSANAQRTEVPVAPATAVTDFTKSAAAELGKAGGSVMVIDNKGTRKFLQSNNGLTMFTDTAPDGGVVTTWQLGGKLTDNTYIDTDGKVFAIQGIKAVDTASTTPENIAATALGTTAAPSTGYSIMVRDEATGETKKMLAGDLLQVQTIGFDHEQLAYANADVDIAVTDLPAVAVGDANQFKISVFRNGAKLRLGLDFTVVAGSVKILMAQVPMYKDDLIQIRYIK